MERSYCHRLILEDFCEKFIGSRIAWVMGACPMERWRISDSDEEAFFNPQNQYVYCGDYKYQASQVLLSNNDEEFPGIDHHVLTPYREQDKYKNITPMEIKEIV